MGKMSWFFLSFFIWLFFFVFGLRCKVGVFWSWVWFVVVWCSDGSFFGV